MQVLNYMKSELYRNVRSKNNYLFLIGFVAFVILINVSLGLFANTQVNFPYGTTKYSLSSFYSSMVIPFFLCLTLTSLVFGQEYKNHTLINTVAYGISRHQIFLGKLIVTMIISVINIICISAAFIASAYLMLETSSPIYLYELLYALIGSLPLFILATVFAHSCHFAFDSDLKRSSVWLTCLVFIPQILSLVGRRIIAVRNVANWMPWNIFKNATFDFSTQQMAMNWSNPDIYMRCIIVGVLGSILFYLFGLESFKRKEIV